MPSFFKNITIDDVGYVKLPVGDTGQRPGTPQNGQMRFNSDRGIPEFRDNAQAEWKRQNQPSQVVATGGDAVYDIAQFGKKYRVHVFTQDGTFSVSKGGDVEYLVVAGSGGGGGHSSAGFFNDPGGGGGAGGLITGKKEITSGSYSAIVGAGGASSSNQGARASSGGDSSIFNVVSTGGGGGAVGANSGNGINGGNGGSGGGAAAGFDTGATGGSGETGQGTAGGSVPQGTQMSGGGGGASQKGNDASPPSITNGGRGIMQFITGIDTFFAGGGAGGGSNRTSDNQEQGGIGGLGGGGNGGDVGVAGVTGGATNGVPNTGGGGGGAGGFTSEGEAYNGAEGGSGIVVARYEIRDEEQLAPADQDITEGLILDLDFAKPTVYTGSGSTVSDSRLFPIEGDLIGNPDFNNPRTHRSAFRFDGSSDYIEIDYNNISNSTFIFWAVLPASGEQQVFSIGNSASSAIGLTFYSTRDNFIQLVASSLDQGTSGNTGTFGVSSGLTTDIYYHFTLTTNSSGQLTALYLNGEAQPSQSNTSRVYNIENLTRLGTRTDGNYAYTGPISFYRTYDRILNSQEVQQLYNLTRWRFGV